MKTDAARVTTTVPVDMAFLPLAVSFAENSATALGLGPSAALKLTLACEEVFGYLARVSPPDETVTLEARGGGYYVRLAFHFTTREFDLRLFNLTAHLSPDDEDALADLGLLIASRSVERFQLVDDAQEGVALLLFKDKEYPAVEASTPPTAEPGQDLDLRSAGDEDLVMVARLLVQHHQPETFRPSFAIGGKLVDMVAGGEYSARVAVDSLGRLGGAILWNRLGPRMIRCYGPYLFDQLSDSKLGAQLVESCLAALAKSDATGLVCLYPPPELPHEYFELLGSFRSISPGGVDGQADCYYRQLSEDPGGMVWAPAELEEFLRDAYHRLAFGRQINRTEPSGRQRAEHSVFSTELDRAHGLATLYPIWDGQDTRLVIEQHVELLVGEGVDNIFCQLDLAHGWQADLATDLAAAGFSPVLLLPYGGKADVVVFRHGNR